MPATTANSSAAEMTGVERSCVNCGLRVPAAARFCPSCGTAVERDARADTQAIEVVDLSDEFAFDRSQFDSSQGLLIVTRGPNVGSRYSLDGPRVSIGRHPDSEIFLDDVTVSRRHAEVLHDANAFSVRDASSLNGTYLNRERIDAASLVDGDELQIGKFKLVFFHGTKH